MQQTLKHRTAPHAAGEPAELYGKVGEPMPRAVYAYTTADGKDLFVAVNSEGRVVASVRAPRVKESNPLTEQAFQEALGKIWIALEIADPCDDPERQYPNVWTA